MITNSPQKTIELGKNLAKKLKKGSVVVLYGGLGSGKTTFAKGIGQGLGVKNARHINSPTFVLIKEYKGKIPLYHIDLYRLDNLDPPQSGEVCAKNRWCDFLLDIEEIGIEEYIYGDGVAVIEWPEKIKRLLPKSRISVEFKVRGENKRDVKINKK